MSASAKNQENEFDVMQLQQCFETIRKLHSILHSVVPVIILIYFSTITFIFKEEKYGFLIATVIFQLILDFYIYRVRRMTLITFISAISIEKKYEKENGCLYLASTYFSFIYDHDLYKELKQLDASSLKSDMIEKYQSIDFNHNFGKPAQYVYILSFLFYLHFIVGVLAFAWVCKDYLISQGIVEPVHLFTNVVLGLIAIWLGTKFFWEVKEKHFYHICTILFFYLIGLASILGGISHGLYPEILNSWMLVSWIVACMALFFLEYIFVYASNITSKIKNKIVWVLIGKVIISVVLIATISSFIIPLVNFLLGLMGIVIVVSLIRLGKVWRIFTSIAIGILSVVIFLLKFPTFAFGNLKITYLDVSHLLLIVSLILLFYGIKSELFSSMVSEKQIKDVDLE